MTTIEQQSQPTPRTLIDIGLAAEVSLVGGLLLNMRVTREGAKRRYFGNACATEALRDCARALRQLADGVEVIAQIGVEQPGTVITFSEDDGAHVVLPVEPSSAAAIVEAARRAVAAKRSNAGRG